MNHLAENTSYENFKKMISKETKLILLDFSATWCGPCKRLSKLLAENIIPKYNDVYFIKIDVDENDEIAQEFNISCMPTIIFLKQKEKDGKKYIALIERIEGCDVEQIESAILKHKQV